MHWTSCADSIKQYPSARIVWADHKQAQGGGAAECRYRWEVWSGPSLRRPAASSKTPHPAKPAASWPTTKVPASHAISPLSSQHWYPRPSPPLRSQQCNARPRGEIFKGEILAKPSEPNSKSKATRDRSKIPVRITH